MNRQNYISVQQDRYAGLDPSFLNVGQQLHYIYPAYYTPEFPPTTFNQQRIPSAWEVYDAGQASYIQLSDSDAAQADASLRHELDRVLARINERHIQYDSQPTSLKASELIRAVDKIPAFYINTDYGNRVLAIRAQMQIGTQRRNQLLRYLNLHHLL